MFLVNLSEDTNMKYLVFIAYTPYEVIPLRALQSWEAGITMFTRGCFSSIRELEAFVYDGPETVEQIYERDDSFHAFHPRRRESATNGALDSEDQSEIWYWYRFDPETNEIDYKLP